MVAVRCRPFNQREKDQKEGKVITIKEGGYCGIENPSEPDAPPREFSFDFTYDDDSEQLTIYRNLGAPLLDKAFHISLYLTTSPLYLPRRAAARQGVPGVERHHLRVRPDGERQVLLHDGLARPARHHPADERGDVRQDRQHAG